MSKLVDNWCVDWDRVKTVYEPSDEPCAHWECSYKHCVYHEFYDPEIVFFADKLDAYTDQPEFRMISPDGTTFVTRFSSAELNYVTRWILYNGEQQVAAFALPATCRPEGYLAAQRNGTLIQVAPQQTRTFTVTTGIE